MSIQTFIERNLRVAAIVASLPIIAAILVIIQFSSAKSPGAAMTQAHFSTDDGASWFADDINKISPVTINSKEAVQALVVRCGNGKPFVAYLLRYTPAGKKILEDAVVAAAAAKAKSQKPMSSGTNINMVNAQYREVKKPMTSEEWVNEVRDPAKYRAIVKLSCPDGGSLNDMEIVVP